MTYPAGPLFFARPRYADLGLAGARWTYRETGALGLDAVAIPPCAGPVGCTRVLPIVPMRSTPVDPRGSVRAPRGVLLGDCGMLWLELGAEGDW